MKKYLGILLLAITTTSLTSCLKDGRVNLPPGGSPPVIEFSTNLLSSPTSDVNSPVGVYTKAYAVVPSATLEITVGYTGGSPAPQDITVNLDNVGTDKITAYNEYKDKNYELMPTNLYSGMPSSVVIKKGENFAKFTVTFKPNQFDFSKSFALPMHISSVSSGTISGNYGTILLAVGVKNKYDGVYTVQGSYSDIPNPLFTGYFPYTADLETLSATTNDVYNEDLGTYGFLFYTATGGLSYYGSFSPQFTFDPATDKIIKVENGYGQGSGASVRSAELDPTGVNQYDPATKTFKVKYKMLQGAAGTVRATFDETYTFTGDRP